METGMPLPEPAPRRLLHNRTIVCEGFERDDGLWDIDAHLTDVKTYGFENRDRGTIGPGEPIHGMWLRLTLDEDFLVHGVEAAMDYTPFAICNTIAPSHVKLIGERIGPGWNRRVRELLGGTQGCTHMREMLGRMATVAIQSMYGRRSAKREEAEEAGRKPFVIDGCHAWASDGPVVEIDYPDWFTGKTAADG
jgi:hypothetical protein